MTKQKDIVWLEQRKKELEGAKAELLIIEKALELYYNSNGNGKPERERIGSRLKELVLECFYGAKDEWWTNSQLVDCVHLKYKHRSKEKLKGDVSVILSNLRSDGRLEVDKSQGKRNGYKWKLIK